MRLIRNKFGRNTFLKSFSLLASGSIIAQLISIFTSPITTRLFTPEEFGIYTLVITAMSLFGPVICLKYDMAIVNSKNEIESFTLIKISLFLCILLSIIFSLFFSFLFLSEDFSAPTLYIYTVFIFLLLMLYGVNNILVSHNNRNSLYKLMTSVTILKSVTSNSFLIIGGLLNSGAMGLVLSQIIGSLVGVKRQSKDIIKNRRKFKGINTNQLIHVFIKYKDQPIYNATSAIIATSVYSSITLFIKLIYTAEQLGLYSLSYRILGIPFSIISANIARVFFESAVKSVKDNGDFKKLFIKTSTLLSLTIIPIISFLALIAPWLFSFVFGQEWSEAGTYVRLLAPMFAIRLITESLTTTFIVVGKQRYELVFQIILLVGEIIAFSIAYFYDLPIETLLIMISILYFLVYVFMLNTMYKLSGNK